MTFDDARSWLQAPLPFAALRRFDADLTLQAKLIKTDQVQVRDLAARAARGIAVSES